MLSKYTLPAALLFAATSSLLFAQSAAITNVDTIVQRHLTALGGLDKMRSIQTTKATGKMTMGGQQGQPMEATITFWNKRPSLQRLEIAMQGQKITQGFDGKTGWLMNPAMGSAPQIAPEEEAKSAVANIDPDGSPLADYKTKGNKVQLLGKEDVNGNVAYKLQVTLRSGSTSLLYLDEKTFLPVKTSAMRPQAGQAPALAVETYSSDFRAINGVMMPFVTETRVGGRTMVRTVMDKIEANIPADDALFAVPAPLPSPRPMPVPRPPATKQ
ncbi:hypothetical protein F183_A00700 [Bryobacterales bacterium F-183]|nr:hypothetical protein F183_A00700 [Bryobacterales bacterium F-183]